MQEGAPNEVLTSRGHKENKSWMKETNGQKGGPGRSARVCCEESNRENLAVSKTIKKAQNRPCPPSCWRCQSCLYLLIMKTKRTHLCWSYPTVVLCYRTIENIVNILLFIWVSMGVGDFLDLSTHQQYFCDSEPLSPSFPFSSPSLVILLCLS